MSDPLVVWWLFGGNLQERTMARADELYGKPKSKGNTETVVCGYNVYFIVIDSRQVLAPFVPGTAGS